MKVGILGLQGSFFDHQKFFDKTGVETKIVKTIEDLNSVDGLVIPGGESTAIRRIIDRNNLMDSLKQFCNSKAVYGTCAGMILLAKEVESNNPHIGVLDVTVKRNAFGRQVDSFETGLKVKGISDKVEAVFIRAPYISNVQDNVEVLSEYEGKVVAVRQNNILATSFHPELTDDTKIAEYFIDMVKQYR